MPQESLGFVRLEWDCPKCGGRNPGPEKTCLSCGAPQPDDVEFVQAESQTFITDQSEIEQAKSGPDIHCAFCGTRNLATATECTQCGADLSQGQRRETGRVVGAYQTGPVKMIPCPHCGSPNPETTLQCAQCGGNTQRTAAAPAATSREPAPTKTGKGANRIVLFAALGFVLLCAVIAAFMFFRTEDQTGVVQSVEWMRAIAIESLQPATYQTWKEEIPSEGEIGFCEQRVHHTQNEPAANANKVCGTPYSKDTGTGHAEVVQDCVYEVLMDWCEFTVMEWTVVDRAIAEGNDFAPNWPVPQLAEGQRQGAQEETYTIIFETSNGEQLTYSVGDLANYQQFQIDSEWILAINALGAIMSVEPVR